MHAFYWSEMINAHARYTNAKHIGLSDYDENEVSVIPFR